MNYLAYLDDELVTLIGYSNRKQRAKGTHTQVYYHTDDGRYRHASRFRRLSINEVKALHRDNKLNQLLE